MKNAKAKVTQVPFGSYQIEGLLLPNNNFGIAASQVAALFEFAKDQVSRDIKALLGKSFQFAKVASEKGN